MPYLRRYNTTLDLTTAGSLRIRIPIRKAGAVDFATGSDWTPATGDVKVAKNGGSQANIGTLPTYSNGAWEFTLSGTELSARTVDVAIVDSATKAVDDEGFSVETFGDAGAMFPSDYGDAVRLGMTALPNAAAGAVGGLYGAVRGTMNADGPVNAGSDTFPIALRTGGGGAGDVLVVTVSGVTYTHIITVCDTDQLDATGVTLITIVPPLYAGLTGTETITLLRQSARADLPAAPSDWLTADSVKADAVTKLAAGVWNALTAGLTTVNSIGKRLVDFVTTLVYAAPPSAADNATAVRTELATELGRIDVATSTRLAGATYVAPDNAGVASIQAKTDNLPADPATQASVDGVKSQTDQLVFVAGKVDANASVSLTQADIDSIVAGIPSGRVSITEQDVSISDD